MRILITTTFAILCGYAGTANAETQAERDGRRSGFIAGFSCSVVAQGQPMTIRYFEGGTGRVEWQEDDAAVTWSIEKDMFCIQVTGAERQCSDLGAAASANEEAEFEKELNKICL